MTTKTLHGCTCLKDWVKIDGEKYSGCVYGDAADPKCPMTIHKGRLTNKCVGAAFISSCPVEKGCGQTDASKDNTTTLLDSGGDWHEKAKKHGVLKDMDYWDICEPEVSGGFGHPKIPSDFFNMSRSATMKAIIGLIIFLLVAGFIIPYILYRMGHNTLVNVWIPNIDLIASVFAFRGGLFDSMLFRFLYTEIPDTTFGFWSKLIIEYFALLGLTLITAQMVWRRKSVSKGMSFAIIMLICSYLLPNAVVEAIMMRIRGYLDKYRPLRAGGLSGNWGIPILSGLLVVIGFILIERVIIDNYLHKIDKLSAFIVNKLWYSLGQGGKRKK